MKTVSIPDNAARARDDNPEAGWTEETKKYAVGFERAIRGYGTHVPDLPGCIALGNRELELSAIWTFHNDRTLPATSALHS